MEEVIPPIAKNGIDDKSEEKLVRNKARTRYNGRVKRRQWEDNKRSSDDADASKRQCLEPFERVKRRKFAMLLGYSGANYYGMQRNPGVNTIEEDLAKAMLATKYITEEQFKDLYSLQFQRTARTDKGVSAARQVVSLKLPEHSLVEALNEHLPNFIRIFGLKRVTKGFNCKNQCDARTYTYTLPSYSFDVHKNLNDAELRRNYRMTQERMDYVNKLLGHFKGTKNYFNFTSKKAFTDPSSLRVISSFTVEKCFISDGLEFAILKVKGQSFMLHQIRKMVGLMLAVARGLTDESTLTRAFSADRIDIPRAPGLGLVLDEIHYDRYNTKYGTDGIHASLTWDEVQETVEKFKEEYVLPTIVQTEAKDHPMAEWLEYLSMHSYDVRNDENLQDKDQKTGDVNSEDEVDDEVPSEKPGQDIKDKDIKSSDEK